MSATTGASLEADMASPSTQSAQHGLTQDIDTLFLLFSAYLVVFMQAGFGLLSAGSVRAKNTKAIFMKILLNTCVAGVCYYLVGFAFAFGGDFHAGDGGNAFIGHRYFGLQSVPLHQLPFFLFQFGVAAACCSIVAGAVEERMDFMCYLLLLVYLSSFVYPTISHWTWSLTGLLDFAGCGAVHMLGGFTGLLGAKILGPRIGRFDGEMKPRPMHGHSATLTTTGVLLLWVGWYGFNPGSALAIVTNSDTVALAAVNTTMAAAFGTISSLVTLMLIEKATSGKVVWNLEGCGNGCLAGLVSITASASFVDTWAASVTGLIGGVLYCASSYMVLNVLKVDDPLDAASVHGANGIWGLIAAAAFATKAGVKGVYHDGAVTTAAGATGFLVGGDGTLLACALIGVVATLAWAAVTMGPFFCVLKQLRYLGVTLRISAEDEMAGLDVADHGGPAYVGGGVYGSAHGARTADKSLKWAQIPWRRQLGPHRGLGIRREDLDRGHQ